MRNRSLLFIPAFALLAAPGLCSAQDIDIGVRLSGGRITPLQFIDGLAGPDERVFGGDVLFVAGAAFGDEPGFRAEAGTFEGPGNLTVAFRSSLRAWNGSGFSSTGTRLNVQADDGSFSVFTPTFDPTPGGPLTTYSMLIGPGELHTHFSNYLLSPDLTSPAPAGIYLLEFDLATDLRGISRSERSFLVLNLELPEAEHDAAMDYVRQNLVPAPAGAAMLGLVMFGAVRRR